MYVYCVRVYLGIVQKELKESSSFHVLLIQYFTHCWMPTGQSIRACGCRLFLSTRPHTRTQSAWYHHVSRIGVENDEIAIFFLLSLVPLPVNRFTVYPRDHDIPRLPASALAISKHSTKQAASNAVPRAVSKPRRLQTAPLHSQLPPRRQTPHGHRRRRLNTPQRIRLPPRLRPLRSLARRRIRRPPPAPVRRHRGR